MDEPNSAGPPPAPRWVKVGGILFLLLIATVLIVHLAGGGFRGHGAH